MSQANDSTAPRRSKFSELQQRDQAALEAEALSRRALNALTMTSSIVNALIESPGPTGDGETLVKAARAMLGSADETANRLGSELGLGNINWSRFRLMRLATEAVSARWTTSARMEGEPSADVSMFIPVWHEMAKQELPSIQYDDPAEDDRVALQIAILEAMMPVMQEIAIFDMFRDPLKSAIHAREQMLEAVNQSMAELMPQPDSKMAFKMLQHALLRNAGTVYASSWRKESEAVLKMLDKLTPREQLEEPEKHPGGWPIEPVDEGFQISFAKLTEMVSYLAAPMKEPASEPAQPQAQAARDPSANPINQEPEFVVPEEIIDVPDWLNEAPKWDDDGPLSPEDLEADEALLNTRSARTDGN